jgi:hypothetical protein
MNPDFQTQIYAGWDYYGVKLCAYLVHLLPYRQQKIKASKLINIPEPIYLYFWNLTASDKAK